MADNAVCRKNRTPRQTTACRVPCRLETTRYRVHFARVFALVIRDMATTVTKITKRCKDFFAMACNLLILENV